ncbi:hypothetical protein Q1695_004376 [Nippostrongylus brasiliensis]|nr:hypothetical protein Q1695_004376 [Nippostrongylus brasiliensis]
MAISRLIFLVTMLTISDAIADECKHRSEEFCYLLTDAHDTHQDYLKLMEEGLDGNGKRALKLADKRVVEALNAEEQALIPALKKALQAELSAFVQVKADCFGLDDSYSEKCEMLCFEVAYVIAELMQAIIEVHPDREKKAEVEAILSDLDEHMFKEPASDYENAAHALGKRVLEGTATIKDLPCAFKTEIPGFCGLIKKAHKVNVATVFNLNGTHFEDVRKNLTKADEALTEVLRMKKKSELFAPLTKALESENCALSELKVICNGTKMESGCRSGRRGLQRSSLTLIKAIKKIVDEKQNKTIIEAEEEFLKGRQNGKNLIEDFARNVLKVIKSQQISNGGQNATSKGKGNSSLID